jgi:hypothetical protein
VELGEHRPAAAAASQLLQAAVDPANDAYNAACCLARCVPLAEHDGHLADAQRKELARSYSDQAMAALRRAFQNGCQDAAHLKTDRDLDALRDRDDFRKLLARLGAKPKR